MNGNLTLIFMNRGKYYKKIVICENIFLTFIAYVALNQSQFLRQRQFYPEDLGNFAGIPSSSFYQCSFYLMIRPNCCIAAMDLAAAPPGYLFIDNRTWLYLLCSSSSAQLYGPCFAITNLRVSCIHAFLQFSLSMDSVLLNFS